MFVEELVCEDFIFLLGLVYLVLDEFLEIGCDCVGKDVVKLLGFISCFVIVNNVFL